MSSKVDVWKRVHQSFNKRDLDAIVKELPADFTATNRARGFTLEGTSEYREWLEEWIASSGDVVISDASYGGGDDVVVALYVARGTHDGPIVERPGIENIESTGRAQALPMCDVVWFGDRGRPKHVDIYYDQLTLMAQIGLADHARERRGLRK